MTWKLAILGNHSRVKHGFAFKGEFFDTDGPYVLLTPGSFFEQGGFRDQGPKTKYYTGDVPDGYVLSEGDLIVAMTEQTPGLLGSSAWISESGRYLHNQRLGRIIDIDEANLDKKFLYYLFNTPDLRHQISATATGGKVRHTAPERIEAVRFRRPPLEEQREIASFLSAYEDLYENNHRRTTLLEEAARQLYHEWFIRLRFPGREHVRVKGRTPNGWQPTVFGDICEEIRESVSPEAMEPDTPYIGLEHIPRRSISLNEWGTVEEVTSSKHRYRENDILFGKIRPYFHKVGMAFTDGVASSDAIVIRPKDAKLLPLVLMTASSDPFVAATSQTMREGSKMPRADWKQMQAYPVPLPPDGLLQSFNDFINPILAQLKTLSFMNRRLKAARDLLLPRVMSGEVAV